MSAPRTLVFIAGLALAGSAAAEYTLTAQAGGTSAVIVPTGVSLQVDVVLTSDGADVHNSAIFRVELSAPGLEYLEYAWAAPYATGTVFDDGHPFVLDLPMTVDDGVLTGPGYPAGVVDVELSNALDPNDPEPDTFGTGLLATLTFEVPVGFPTDQPVNVCLVPDAIADGFDLVPTVAGPPLEITIALGGDSNLDGYVDVNDLVNVIIGWGACPDPPTPCDGDVNQDGTVNVSDLELVILNWLPPPPL